MRPKIPPHPETLQIVPLNSFEDRIPALIDGKVDAVVYSERAPGRGCCWGGCCRLGPHCFVTSMVLSDPALGCCVAGRLLPPCLRCHVRWSAPAQLPLHSCPILLCTPLNNCRTLPYTPAGFTVTADRSKLVQFVYPSYYSSGAAVFAPGGSIEGVSGWGDLEGQTLAVAQGSYVIDAAPQTPALQNITLVPTPTIKGGCCEGACPPKQCVRPCAVRHVQFAWQPRCSAQAARRC